MSESRTSGRGAIERYDQDGNLVADSNHIDLVNQLRLEIDRLRKQNDKISACIKERDLIEAKLKLAVEGLRDAFECIPEELARPHDILKRTLTSIRGESTRIRSQDESSD